MSIADYLASRGADEVLSAVVEAAYVGEYDREITEQSALNFLLYIRADRRLPGPNGAEKSRAARSRCPRAALRGTRQSARLEDPVRLH